MNRNFLTLSFAIKLWHIAQIRGWNYVDPYNSISMLTSRQATNNVLLKSLITNYVVTADMFAASSLASFWVQNSKLAEASNIVSLELVDSDPTSDRKDIAPLFICIEFEDILEYIPIPEEEITKLLTREISIGSLI